MTNPSVTPLPSVHTPPREVPGANLPDPTQFLSWGSKFIDGIVKQVVLAIVGVVVPGSLVQQLQHWAQTLLPAQIMKPIQDLVDLLVTLLGPLPIVGTVVKTLAGYFGLLKDQTDTAQATGENAQTSADNANVGVARLEGQVAAGNVPSGVIIDDTFARTGATLGSGYDQAYSGSGGGTLGTDGDYAKWSPGGSSALRTCLARSLTTLATDYQSAAFVQNTQIGNVLTSPMLFLVLRCDATRTNYVIARITYSTIEIGKVVAGTFTSLKLQGSSYNAAGDRWQFKAGTTGDVREFVLYQNGTEVLRITDTAATSVVGSSNRFPGFGMVSGQAYAYPFFTSEYSPPKLQSFTANDRLAAA